MVVVSNRLFFVSRPILAVCTLGLQGVVDLWDLVSEFRRVVNSWGSYDSFKKSMSERISWYNSRISWNHQLSITMFLQVCLSVVFGSTASLKKYTVAVVFERLCFACPV